MWDCLAQSTHKQRLAADRIAHIKGAQTESLEHHNLLQGAQGIRLRVINEAQHPVAQKLTRPDGEIRAGRVDRRRGSGGVSADRGCNSGLDGPFAY
jgi:hypothetical protein